ncbi:MAG: UvrD-helicase domain-containing protein [Bacteroidales bacterium]|jgi:ATP-dependent exoDNAse (exonuclease V) beta subunit|nr:UvrD-helicase domain-containing protein [Bacteroidales bacterium]
MLTVYKASAGSGKTYQLVVEYLKLLLQNPYNYRHILAVTFTNKATSEMKSRILEYLNALSKGVNSAYSETLKNELNFSDETIRQKAQQVFKNILHDYNHFSISTLDSFTQRVIKSFNRELGISPNFALELDSNMILEEAVDRLLAKIGHDKKLLEWLVRFSEEKIIDSKSQRIEKNMISLGQELFKEKFQLFFPETKNSPYTRENIEDLKNELEKIIVLFETTLQHKGKEAIQIIGSNGFTVNDFAYNVSGIAGFFINLSEKKIKTPGPRIFGALDSAEKWFSKTHKQKTELQILVKDNLQPLLGEIIHYYNKESAKYFSAKAVNEQLRILGILTDLKEEIKTLLHEKGILQLSDSNLLLSKIIDESDSPFIYEKVGIFFKYFMIDEFQDTSALQWKNFKPLIANSLSEGNKNLLLGDVKQSIYRWRNSDWNILAEQINSDFPNSPSEIRVLTKNWRSDKNIIEFNNTIIEHLKSAFETNLFQNSNEEWEKQKIKFQNVFSDFKQGNGKKSAEKNGWVKITFLDESDFQERSVQLLTDQVKQLQNKGLRASDIAILIRKNSEGSQIIENFLSAAKKKENENYNLSVLSNESLFLYASRSVLFVIAVMEWLIEPENKITKAALLQLWQTCIKPELKNKGISFPQNENEFQNLDKNFEKRINNELGHALNQIRHKIMTSSIDETICEICSHFQLFKIENELPFLQTLIDKAGEVKISISNDISNFLFWWNEKGYKTSVNINDEVDSIRLLTVHKSKGLEFKAVLIPFLNWKISPTGNQLPILWCRSETEPFNRFPLLPVKAKSELINTLFSKEYIEEIANLYIDTLNLLYVAFTRAKSALFINTVNYEKNIKEVSTLLKESLQVMGTKEPFEKCWNEEKNIFEFGKLNHINVEKQKANLVFINDYSFNNFHDKLKLRQKSSDWLLEGEHNKSMKNRGKIIHEILSKIKTVNDLNKACEQALYDGKIDENELLVIKQELMDKFQKMEIKHWFDGSWKVINERNLLTLDKIMRPDRIMVSGKNAVVVDYKTGKQKSEDHDSQVKHYAKILKETGFEKVEAFLWYLALNEVEKVATFDFPS